MIKEAGVPLVVCIVALLIGLLLMSAFPVEEDEHTIENVDFFLYDDEDDIIHTNNETIEDVDKIHYDDNTLVVNTEYTPAQFIVGFIIALFAAIFMIVCTIIFMLPD